jgi:membrane peptidoglycan carboxypeptidase
LTFKVFVLSAAIKQGMSLSTKIVAPDSIRLPVRKFRNCQGYLGGTNVWTPHNSTGSGTFDLYSGTQQSVNTFFAQLELRTGLCMPVTLAREMGVDVPSPVYPPFTLGVSDTNPLTMANAYATFAARGLHCDARPVTQVLDSTGNVLVDFPETCKQVLPKDVADAVNDILRGVQEPGGFGYGAGIELNQPSAGKTGTTDSNRAVWFIGYTPNMSAAVMLAGANGQGHWLSLNGQTVGGTYIAGAHGSTNAGPIWGDAMKAIEKWLPNEDFHSPDPRIVKGKQVIVPSVAGYDPSKAAKVLQAAGLNPVIGSTVSSGSTPGTVAYLVPAAGTQASSGSNVTMYVSGGGSAAPPSP